MIAIGSDHSGYLLKESLIEELKANFEVKDFGTFSPDTVNYPDIAFKLAESVANGECDAGILICRTGIGMSICANKVNGIRCANVNSIKNARLCKEHNDANIISIGADEVSKDAALEIIYTWLSTDFAGGRHKTRVDLILDYEKHN